MGQELFWYGLSPKLIKSGTTSLKSDGFCMYRAIVAIQKLQSAEEEGNGRSPYVDLDLHWVWFFPSCNFSTATPRFFP